MENLEIAFGIDAEDGSHAVWSAVLGNAVEPEIRPILDKGCGWIGAFSVIAERVKKGEIAGAVDLVDSARVGVGIVVIP